VSRRAGTRVRATKKPVVVIAGEDRNDRAVLRLVLEQVCPDMRGRLVEINDAVRLRNASGATLAQRVRTLVRLARARATRERADLACVFVHENFDAPASAGCAEVHRRVTEALAREFGTAHDVLAAAETEAWLLLFPDAVAGHVPTWRVPRQYRGIDTGQLPDPKRTLAVEVSRSGPRYRESEAPAVIAMAVELDILHQPSRTNQSWTQLNNDAAECCRDHVRPGI
jgi:hypothetical protein